MATTTHHCLDEALELAGLLMPAWAQISDRITGPRCEGDDEKDDAADKGEGEKKDDDADKGDDKQDWKAHSRRHEREAKKARKDAEDARTALKEREDADKSEQQKAIDAAKEEGKTEALTQAQQDRRADRLEVAVTRLAAKTFADTEDALTNIERAITRGDLDAEDIYTSEGAVQTAALKTALDDLLERKPHLAAKPPGPGGNDAGKGSGGLTIEEVKAMSPTEINKRWAEVQPVLAAHK